MGPAGRDESVSFVTHNLYGWERSHMDDLVRLERFGVKVFLGQETWIGPGDEINEPIRITFESKSNSCIRKGLFVLVHSSIVGRAESVY